MIHTQIVTAYVRHNDGLMEMDVFGCPYMCERTERVTNNNFLDFFLTNQMHLLKYNMKCFTVVFWFLSSELTVTFHL